MTRRHTFSTAPQNNPPPPSLSDEIVHMTFSVGCVFTQWQPIKGSHNNTSLGLSSCFNDKTTRINKKKKRAHLTWRGIIHSCILRAEGRLFAQAGMEVFSAIASSARQRHTRGFQAVLTAAVTREISMGDVCNNCDQPPNCWTDRHTHTDGRTGTHTHARARKITQ